MFAGSLAWRCGCGGLWKDVEGVGWVVEGVEDVEDVREDVMWAEDGWRMLGDGGCGWRM